MPKHTALVLLGSLGILAGLFLPVASISAGIFSRSVPGYDSDLIFTAPIGVIALLVALIAKGKPGKAYSAVITVLAVVNAGICFVVFLNVAGVGKVSAGPAVYLSGLASLLVFVGGATVVPAQAAPQPAE